MFFWNTINDVDNMFDEMLKRYVNPSGARIFYKKKLCFLLNSSDGTTHVIIVICNLMFS